MFKVKKTQTKTKEENKLTCSQETETFQKLNDPPEIRVSISQILVINIADFNLDLKLCSSKVLCTHRLCFCHVLLFHTLIVAV